VPETTCYFRMPMKTPTPLKTPPFPYWALVLFLTTLACTTITRGVQSPSPQSAQNGLIAYLGPDGNVYTIDENGGHLTPITQDAQRQLNSGNSIRLYQHPTWSHDGRHLAFVAIEVSEGEQIARLLVATSETAEITEIFSDSAETPFYLYWSPDNERVSFLTSAPNAPHLFLRLAFLNGEDSRIVDTGQPYYWVWAPGGEQIFVHEGGSTVSNPDARLSLFSPDDDPSPYVGAGPTQSFALSAGIFQAPAWSPDGERLLAAIKGEGQGELTLLDRNGAATQTIAQFNTSISFSWSPNGEQIAYLATTPESGGFLGPLTLLSNADPASRRVTSEETVLAYFWAPDSQKIAYLTPDTSEGINASLISTQAQASFQLALHVMDVQTGATHSLTTFQPTDDFLSILPFFDQYHHSATLWSPDSTKLVYPALNGDNEAGVWVVQADGGTPPALLAEGTLAFWSWK